MKYAIGNKKIIVCYHIQCEDGFSGAWVAWKKFGNKAVYIPLPPQEMPFEKISNRTVYFIDMCPSADALDALRKNKNEVIVLDHHKTAKDWIKHASAHVFDVKHSGAVLAWKYFFPKKKILRLIAYVEDGDMWTFKLTHSKEIQAVLSDTPFSFRFWNQLYVRMERASERKKLFEKGSVILSYEHALVEKIITHAVEVFFEGKKVYAVNTNVLQSLVGHTLVKKKQPFAIIWSVLSDGRVRVSLRAEGLYDVSRVAKKYGGGGHLNAAGFILPSLRHIPWKELIKKKKK